MTPPDPLYWFWSKELSGQTCDSILSIAQKYEPQTAVVGVAEGAAVVEDVRKSTVRWIEDNFVRFAVQGFAIDANNSAWGFALNSISSIQFTEYTSDQHYDWHTDCFRHEDEMRKVSIVIQLTDSKDYEGGDFQFRHREGEIEDCPALKERGTVLVFPSWVEHRVTPVTKGKRHTLVAWMSGPALV